MLLALIARHRRLSQTSHVDYKKIELLEIELGIAEPTRSNVTEFLKHVYVKDCYFEPSRAFTTPIPINPTTGEELDTLQQLQLSIDKLDKLEI